ncbi:MAG TPA: IclR family transcriptional regulator [Acidimicrobiales bacterium]|nr:IclR family transcriptional regulator [Acidimicrobiales bacterium]
MESVKSACADGTTSDTRSGVLRTFQILRAFRTQKPMMTLSEIARATDLPKTTVHRFLRELVHNRALEVVDGRYAIGLGVFEIGSLYRGGRLRDLLLPCLEDLYQITHEVVHLAVLNGHEVVYLDKLRGQERTEAPSRLGGRMPAYCTGVGKALLAYAPCEVVEATVEAGLHRRTAQTIVDPAALRVELAQIRSDGYAVDREENTPGVSCVAARVSNRRRESVAAISVTVPTARFDLQRLAPTVQAMALAASRTISNDPLLSGIPGAA